MPNLVECPTQTEDLKLSGLIIPFCIGEQVAQEHDRLDLKDRWWFGQVRVMKTWLGVVDCRAVTGFLGAVRVDIELSGSVVIGEPPRILEFRLEDSLEQLMRNGLSAPRAALRNFDLKIKDKPIDERLQEKVLILSLIFLSYAL